MKGMFSFGGKKPTAKPKRPAAGLCPRILAVVPFAGMMLIFAGTMLALVVAAAFEEEEEAAAPPPKKAPPPPAAEVCSFFLSPSIRVSLSVCVLALICTHTHSLAHTLCTYCRDCRGLLDAESDREQKGTKQRHKQQRGKARERVAVRAD